VSEEDLGPQITPARIVTFLSKVHSIHAIVAAKGGRCFSLVPSGDAPLPPDDVVPPAVDEPLPLPAVDEPLPPPAVDDGPEKFFLTLIQDSDNCYLHSKLVVDASKLFNEVVQAAVNAIHPDCENIDTGFPNIPTTHPGNTTSQK
jgi:hypothetical protein